MTIKDHYDVICVGGGLANCLIAWRLRTRRPRLSVLIVESEAALGGNHTWSFHGEDLAPDQRGWVEPFVAKQWPGYTVRFPRFVRPFFSDYFSIRSDRFGEQVRSGAGADVMVS